MSSDINVLAIVKGDEKYVFMFTDENAVNVLRTIGRFASNAELSFDWYDAAMLSQKVRAIEARYNATKATGRIFT